MSMYISLSNICIHYSSRHFVSNIINVLHLYNPFVAESSSKHS